MKRKIHVIILLCISMLISSCSNSNINIEGNISKYEKHPGIDSKSRVMEINVEVHNYGTYDSVTINVPDLGSNVFGGAYATGQQDCDNNNLVGAKRVYKTTNYLSKDQLVDKMKDQYVEIVFERNGEFTTNRINLLEFVTID